jgi:alkyl sulfatase BDS1-like metallo-beta-lactamase superfamily hydrolase
MHNLVPIRGALVRDALKWSKYIGEMIEMFGADVQLMFASHHWPRWGNDDVNRYLRTQRDLYRWMHDQTMRFANHGYTAVEIAEMLTMPADFLADSHTVGYYGQLAHNVKAVHQRYLSWYDGNPANLWKLPPVEAGSRYVDLAGGPDRLLAAAQRGFDAGDYRWVAELLNHLVFSDPSNAAARQLQADTFEQLGYQSESATFRNAYLTGAHELRNGTLPSKPAMKSGLLAAMSVEQVFDSMAVRLKAEEVEGVSVEIDVVITDVDERWVLGLQHCALHAVPGSRGSGAAATLTTTRAALFGLAEGSLAVVDSRASGTVTIDGDGHAVEVLFGHLDVFMTNFAIVEP